MMQTRLILLSFLCIQLLNAQDFETLDTAQMMFTYEYQYQLDSIDKESVKTDEMILLIGEKYSQFLSKNRYQMDSIIKGTSLEQVEMILPQIMKIKVSFFTNFSVFKNYPNKENLTFLPQIVNDIYEVKESMATINWKLEEDQKTIMGHLCKLATAKFGGRNYTAWYAPEIPISEGPYKFHGLPGLILEIASLDGEHAYTIKGLEKLNYTRLLYRSTRKSIPASTKDYLKAISAHNKDSKKVEMMVDHTNPEVVERIRKKLRARNNFIEK